MISTSAKNRKKKDLKEKYMNENGLAEAELEIEDQEDIIDAVKEFVGKRNNK